MNKVIGVLWVLKEIELDEEIRANKVIRVLWVRRVIKANGDLRVIEMNMVIGERRTRTPWPYWCEGR